MRLANAAPSTIAFTTADQDRWAPDELPSQTGAIDRPAVGNGFVTMVTLLSGFAVFWLVAGFGIGYWFGS